MSITLISTVIVIIIAFIIIGMINTQFNILEKKTKRKRRAFRNKSQKTFFRDAQTGILDELRAVEGATS